LEDQMRGRVMSLFSMIFVGMAPIGSLSSGAIAEWWGIQWAVILFALLGGAGSLFFLYQHSAAKE